MWKTRSLQAWLKVSRLWDTFYAYCHGGLVAARSVLREIITVYPADRKVVKRRPFLPHVEQLADRITPTTVQFKFAGYSIGENGTTATIDVVLDAATSNTVTVDYSTSNNTATAGSDYTTASGTVTFDPNETTKSFTVSITDDALDENNETVNLTLLNPSNAMLGSLDSAQLTINDDDAAPDVGIWYDTFYSANESVATVGISVWLSAASGKTVTVDYTTVNSTATSGNDYTAASGTLTFSPGELTKVFYVALINDTLDEPDESISLQLNNANNAALWSMHDAGILQITDNDSPPTVSFTTSTQTHDEDVGTMTITAQLSAASGYSISVPFTLSGSATEGSTADYTITASPITISAGSTSGTITITVIDDSKNETKETVIVTMGDPTNATKGTTTVHKARIVDNDAADAVNDSDSTNEDTDLVIAAADLLANDNDPAVLVITGWSQPTTPHGTLEFDGTHFTYKPHANYVGTDSFTYTVKDGDGDTDTATVTITVNGVNDAPIAKDDWTDGPAALNTPMTIFVLVNDSDPDISDTFWIDSIGTTTTAHGLVAIDDGGTSTDPTDDFITFEQTSAHLGDESFTYTITDGDLTATATVTLTLGGGQWANRIIDVSSEWTSSGPYAWYAVQALGKPDTWEYGDVPTAWAANPETGEGSGDPEEAVEQYLTVGFATAQVATGLLIRETYGNGFVTKIELIYGDDLVDNDVPDQTVPVTDDSAADEPAGLVVTFNTSGHTVKGVKITVDTANEADEWEEIDAVKLFSSTVPSFSNSVPSIISATANLTVAEDASVNIHVSSTSTRLASDTDPITIRIITEPTYGWVEINDNGTPTNLSDDFITYTPDPDFNDHPSQTYDDRFTYEVRDIWGETATGVVEVTVNPANDAPYVQDTFVNAYVGVTKTIALASYAEDIDVGDTLTPATSNGSASISGTNINYTSSTAGVDEIAVTVTDNGTGTLSDAGIINVTVFEAGHWASSIESYDSQYADSPEEDWGVEQMLDEPDTFEYGDAATAWAAAEMNDGEQVLVLNFTPDVATGVLVREVNGNGFLTRIEVQDEFNTWHEVWEANPSNPTGLKVDPAEPGKRTDVILRFAPIQVSSVNVDIKRVRLTVDTDHDMEAWEEIDAVRLLTSTYSGPTAFSTTALNNKPSAADVYAAVDAGEARVLSPPSDAFDPNGDTLTITAVGTAALAPNASISFTSTSISYTYTGSTSFTTPLADSFTYTISDGNGGTATATAHVTVYPGGQWATTLGLPTVAAYSSQYAGSDGSGTARQALGAPDTFAYGDISTAWTTQETNDGSHTLTVGFATPDEATGVIIREVGGNGFVTQVEVFFDDSNDVADLTFNNSNDPGNNFPDATATTGPGNLYVSFGGATADDVKAIRITINTNDTAGAAKLIDAIRLLTAAGDASNTAPIGTNYTRSTPENVPTSIAAGAGASDADGDPLHLEFISAAHGSVEINLGLDPDDVADDYLVYHPDPYFNGSDTINYRVVDIWGAYHARTVSITITSVNQAPIAVDDEAVTEVETAVPITVLANDFDPDEDDLTVQNPSNGAHGTTSLTGNVITYTPATSYTGRDSFTYEINDGEGHVTIGTVHVFVYAGQWATHVIDTGSNTSLAENTVLGAPDTFASGTSSAWSPDGAMAFDWVTVGFDASDAAMGVLVRETAGQGFIRRVDLLDTTGVFHTVWAGIDPSGSAITEFIVTFPTVAYDVEGVRVYLDGQSGAAIDAIRLLTHDAPAELTLKTRTFAGENVIVTEYDDEIRPIEETVYAGSDIVQTTEMAYDATAGFLETVLVTDALDRQTQTTYDEDGHKLTETFAYGTADASTTTYAYTDGQLTSLTDPKGNETTWAYVGNTVTMTDYFGNDEVKTYDDDGKLLSILTRNNKLRTFAYDADGRLETETWYGGPTTGAAVVEEFEWTYTASGQVHTAENSVGTYTFTYNASGQVTKVQEPFGVWLQFGYDSAGHRTLVLDSFGGKEESLYDAQGQLVRRILTKGGDTLRLDQTFDAQGRVLTQTRYSDAAGATLVGKSEYKYDAQGRVTEIKHKDDSLAVLSEYDYVYDEAGQLDSWTNQQDGIDSGTPWTLDYSYDEQGQLTSDGAINYDYDVGGNRDTGYTYVADGMNDTNLIETAGGYTYEYDDEGNLTKKEHSSGMDTWVYEYDHARHLTAVRWYNSVTVGTGTLRLDVEYSYDVFGNRVQKVVDDDRVAPTSPVTYKYAIDGWNPAKPSPVGNENYDVWADLNSGGSLTTKYLRGDVVDQLWARIDGSDPRWVLTDHLGSVRDVVDDAGALVDSIAYDSFGNVADESNPGDAGRYMWTGREFDVETGLQYNRARYYDSVTGRWISQDPMGFDAGDSNLYRYVSNQPARLSDPSGLWSVLARNVYSRGKDEFVIGGYETARIAVALEYEIRNARIYLRLDYSFKYPRANWAYTAIFGWSVFAVTSNMAVQGATKVRLDRTSLTEPDYRLIYRGVIDLGNHPLRKDVTLLSGQLGLAKLGDAEETSKHSKQTVDWSLQVARGTAGVVWDLRYDVKVVEHGGAAGLPALQIDLIRLIDSNYLPPSLFQPPFPRYMPYVDIDD